MRGSEGQGNGSVSGAGYLWPEGAACTYTCQVSRPR